ncbi:MAG TPA: glycosyltransferase family 4 protein, partial [Pseudonocardia sp.]|nr:glycosyltransferase family 4 protein [Pseudonocardia sp.]
GSYRGSGRLRIRDGVRYVFLPVGWAGPRGGQLVFQALTPLVALLRRPDLWIESVTPPVSSSLLPVFARCPVVALVQMLSGADMSRRYKLPFTAIERRGLRLYRHFVVLNDTDRQAVRAANPRASVALIPNGIERPPDDEIEYGTGEHVLFLGRIDVRQKGLDLLLAAVPPELPLPVVIAGAGTHHEETRLGGLLPADGHDRIQVVGRVDGRRKRELLRRCAFMVVPSRYETFCLSALEAMAYGKPVVYFDLPQLAWIGPGAGVAVRPFDVAELGAAISRLAGDGSLRARLGRRARERSADYDSESAGARYRALVAELLGHARYVPAPTPARRGARGTAAALRSFRARAVAAGRRR